MGSNHSFDIGIFDSPLVSIGNLVWADINNNGVRDGAEPGIDGVTVNLYDGLGTSPIRSTVTHLGGAYFFRNLDAGAYIVEIIPPSGLRSSTGASGFTSGPFEPGVTGLQNDQDHGTALLSGAIRTVIVALAPALDLANPDFDVDNFGAANNANFRQDFGLFRPLSIGNFVWEDANNSGKLDAGEKAFADVMVSLFDSQGVLVGIQTTNANGNYLFTDLAPGSYTVRVLTPNGYVSSTGLDGGLTGPYEPGVSGFQDNEDHGTKDGTTVFSTVTLGLPGSAANPDIGGLANLRQDFGFFLPFLVIEADCECIRDTPWINYDVSLTGIVAPNGVTITFTKVATGEVVQVLNNQPMAGRLLYPGAAVDANGDPIAWPGWELVNGEWVEIDDGLRPEIRMTISVNPESSVVLTYPPPSPFCVPEPTVSLGNFVFRDWDGNGKFSATAGDHGIDGVVVELWSPGPDGLAGSSDDARIDADGVAAGFQDSIVTSGGGFYLFDRIPSGQYYVRIPASQFAVGAPLAGFLSSRGWGTDDFTDQDGDENGIDVSNPAVSGVVSVVVNLQATVEPVTEVGPFGPGNGQTNDSVNLTVDFGFVCPVSIGNFVWNDANNNGVLDGGESGLANVPVELLDAAGAVIGSMTTNVNGNYLFTVLQPGTYRVRIIPPQGYVTSTGTGSTTSRVGTGPYEPGVTGIQDNEDHGTAAGFFITTADVVLTPDGNPDDGGLANLRQDFGLFLPPNVPPPPPPPATIPASVSGYVYRDTFDTNCVRQPANGELGIPFTTIILTGVDLLGNPLPRRTTTTDANGFYQFTNLLPGSYTITEIQPVGWLDACEVPGSLGGSNPSNDVLTVGLQAGDDGIEYNFGEVELRGDLRIRLGGSEPQPAVRLRG